MAVFSLSALLVLLAVIALSATKPWGATAVVPDLSLAPDVGVGLADAVGLAPSAEAATGGSRSAPSGPALAAATRVQRGSAEAGPQIGIAGARPVAQTAPTPPRQPPAEPTPVAPIPTQPAPVAVPVSTSDPSPSPDPDPEPGDAVPGTGKPVLGSGPHGPTTAGVDLGLPFASFRVEEGGTYVLSVTLRVDPSASGAPGDDNLLIRFSSGELENLSLELPLWDDAELHELELYFQASSGADGFYLALLDGEPVDARAGVSLIAPGSEGATIEVGLFREGEFLPAGPEVVFVAASLVDAPEPLFG